MKEAGMAPIDPPKNPPSKVEAIKEMSNGLAGTIRESLAGEQTHFGDADTQLIKFHGSYQQDNRDLRVQRKREGLDKAWSYMIRVKMPAGKLTAEQYLALDEIGTNYTHDQSIRLTSRQGVQFHGIGRQNFKKVIREVCGERLSTLGACGDVNRNVMACGVSDLDWRAPLGLNAFAAQLAEHFAPRTSSYWEIWCDGEKWGEPVRHSTEEPIYGTHYMPRKFKMAAAVPEDNDVDLYTQDIGWEAVHDGKQLLAWDLIVGGGMGFSHGKTETYPRLGDRSVRVKPEEAIEVAEHIFGIQRDFGDRSNRSHARFKYVMAERGLPWFKEELFRRLGRTLPDAGPMPQYKVDDHLGWHEANDGTLFLGIYIGNGRIIDGNPEAGGAPIRTGLREIVRRFNLGLAVTPKQNLVLTGIDPALRGQVESMVAEYGLQTDKDLGRLRRISMACVALPTCGLALAESERFMPTLLERLEGAGVGDADVEIRMTGCPNSCVRTPTAEIGISGRGPGKYNVFIGGNQEGTRLGYLFKETVTDAQLSPIIKGLIDAWRGETGGGVSFGDWAAARGGQALGEIIVV